MIMKKPSRRHPQLGQPPWGVPESLPPWGTPFVPVTPPPGVPPQMPYVPTAPFQPGVPQPEAPIVPKVRFGTDPRRPPWERVAFDPSQLIDLPGMFRYVFQARLSPEFRDLSGKIIVPVQMIVRPTLDPSVAVGEASAFFKLADPRIQRERPEEVWKNVIEKVAQRFREELSRMKPKDLPGTFQFEFADDGSWWLVYRE